MCFLPRKVFFILVLLFSPFLSSHVNAALILHVNANNLLTGADNVLVDGNLYNVYFSDMTGRQLFEQSPGVFDFGPVNDSNKNFFSTALLDQVLLGIYDTMPELTFGCENTDNDTCRIFSAFRTFSSGNIGAHVAVNFADALTDGISSGNPFPDDQFDVFPVGGFQPNTANPQQQVWAVWTPVSRQSIPITSTMWLLLTALGGLLLKGRNKTSI